MNIIQAKAAIEAVFEGNVDVLLRLAHQGLDLNSVRENRNSLMNIAATLGDFNVMDILFDAGYCQSEASQAHDSPLLSAFLTKRLNVFEYLLRRGINPSREPANSVPTTLHKICLMGELDYIELLLKYSDDHYINQTCRDGHTALLYGISSGVLPTVEILLKSGALIDGDITWSMTPLGQACVQLNRAMVKLLIDRGANRSMVDRYGLRPVDFLESQSYEDRERAVCIREMLMDPEST